MAIKLTSIFAMALFIAVATGRPQSFPCSDQPDGVYPDPLDGTKYHICFDGDLILTQSCEDGHHLNEVTRTCVRDDGSDVDALKVGNDLDTDNEDIKSEIEEILRGVEFPGNGPRGNSKYKVYNVQVTENIYPKSVVIIGKANREQKNK